MLSTDHVYEYVCEEIRARERDGEREVTQSFHARRTSDSSINFIYISNVPLYHYLLF